MRHIALVAITCLFLLSACNVATPTPVAFTPVPTKIPTVATLVPTITIAPKPSPSAVATAAPTAVPTVAPTVTAAAASAIVLDVSAQKYIDDRSTAIGLLASLFNAINRHEYVRAYSYWEPEGSIKGTTLDVFQNGYSKTASVQLAVGPMTEGVAAGNYYNSVSVVLNAVTTDGVTQQFVACYLLHLSNPSVQGTLPFHSLGIQQGIARQVANDGDPLSLLGSLCTDVGIPTGSQELTQLVFDPTDISSARYLDDRSDAVQVLRSFFNAINRHEYLRAYSYWEEAAASSSLPSLEKFTEGYSDTQTVQLITGQVSEDAGAGQFHYKVPITIVVSTVSGQTQTFVGCYVLHLSNPGIQGTEPFQPIGIISANVLQVDSAANAAKLMASACN
jgi:hypothetical protein